MSYSKAPAIRANEECGRREPASTGRILGADFTSSMRGNDAGAMEPELLSLEIALDGVQLRRLKLDPSKDYQPL